MDNRQVEGFNRIVFCGPGLLDVYQHDTESLSIDAPRYVLPNIESTVVDGTLKLGLKRTRVVDIGMYKEIVAYVVTLRDLTDLVVRGTGKVLIPDLDQDHVRFELSGNGSITVHELTADTIESRVNGSGMVKLAGDIEHQSIDLHGAAVYSASDLVSDSANVNVTGIGTVGVSVNQLLSARIIGAGTVTYSGYPEVDKQIVGKGAVRRRRDRNDTKRGKQNV